MWLAGCLCSILFFLSLLCCGGCGLLPGSNNDTSIFWVVSGLGPTQLRQVACLGTWLPRRWCGARGIAVQSGVHNMLQKTRNTNGDCPFHPAPENSVIARSSTKYVPFVTNTAAHITDLSQHSFIHRPALGYTSPAARPRIGTAPRGHRRPARGSEQKCCCACLFPTLLFDHS